jgi:hypothetical protein
VTGALLILHGIFASPHQIPQTFLSHPRDHDRCQLSGTVKLRQIFRVARICLHPFTRSARSQRWGGNVTRKLVPVQNSLQMVSVDPRFVYTPNFSRKRLQLLYQASVAACVIGHHELLVCIARLSKKTATLIFFAESSIPTQVIEFVMTGFLLYVAL